MKREPGFYWVQLSSSPYPIVARWLSAPLNDWEFPEFSGDRSANVEVLSERLTPPAAATDRSLGSRARGG